MSIGKIIRELRRKNDMTQEKLADLLGVSYQAVSKWETDVTSPDLSLIVPISRLFHVSTEVLFEIDEENARREEFDAAYEQYWEKNQYEMYDLAQKAVFEFPGDYKYLNWLASMEYYMAFDVNRINEGSNEFFNSMLEKSKKHYETVIRDCTDNTIRQEALHGIVLDLKYLDNPEEARKYAELMPEKQGYNRDMLLELCTEGEERLKIRQKIVYQKTEDLLDALFSLWAFQSEKTDYVRTAVDISENIIKVIIQDQNYYKFYWNLYQLYLEKAEISMADNNYEEAIRHLATAKEFAQKRDFYHSNGKIKYTSTILDHVDGDISGLITTDSMDYWNYSVNQSLYNPLRERKDFQELTGCKAP